MTTMDDQLKEAVERLHECRAELARSVPVREVFGGDMVWEGLVSVFDLAGNKSAKQAFAWSSPIEGSTKRRFFAVLQIPPINTPVDAVRAAIVQEHRTGKST